MPRPRARRRFLLVLDVARETVHARACMTADASLFAEVTGAFKELPKFLIV
jgi:hypothetical protein